MMKGLKELEAENARLKLSASVGLYGNIAPYLT